MNLELCAPCMFGLEGIVSDELKRMDMNNVRAENGRVFFSGDYTSLVKANLRLRCAERVMICLGRFPAPTFDALFEGTKSLNWEDFLTKDANFPVTGHSLDSKLTSIPDCQSIVKKAIVERLKLKYKVSWFDENGALYPVRFAIMKDSAELFIDTSGQGLHKRGYREVSAEAPLRETLAAAMVLLSRYRGRGAFIDPFCGSGTIPIEAALIAKNRAPGLSRSFAASNWPQIPADIWSSERTSAKSAEYDGDYDICGSDISPNAVNLSRSNAVKAGISKNVRFEVSDAARFSPNALEGVVVTNPPYGLRILDIQEAQAIYRAFGQALKPLSGWNYYILSPHPDFEKHFGITADKKRKLYNGMIKCDLYMYFKSKR